METTKITQSEAERLLAMIKRVFKKNIDFPEKGKHIEFDAVGNTNRDVFAIQIYRGKRNAQKYNIGARIKKNGILLLELHVNATNVHINPGGERITGSHWHIYTEEYGRLQAFPADIENDAFIETSIKFLKKFNVIDEPNIRYQATLI